MGNKYEGHRVGDHVAYWSCGEMRGVGTITRTFMGTNTTGRRSAVVERNELFVEMVWDIPDGNDIGNICTVDSDSWSVVVVYRPFIVESIKKHDFLLKF